MLTVTGFLTMISLTSVNTKRIGNHLQPSTRRRGETQAAVTTGFMEDLGVGEGCQVKSCPVNTSVRSVNKISGDCTTSIGQILKCLAMTVRCRATQIWAYKNTSHLFNQTRNHDGHNSTEMILLSVSLINKHSSTEIYFTIMAYGLKRILK